MAQAGNAGIDTVEDLMDRIMRNGPVADASHMLRIIVEQDREAPTAVSLLTFYTGMKQALSEADFRGIGDAADLSRTLRAVIRRDRHRQFVQYRELFELELKLARRLRRQAMAIGENWSDLPGYLRDGCALLGSRLALHWASVSYRWGIPGAMDWCDAAATCMMRSVLTPELAGI
jgi:hypothetical protein